MLQRAVRELSTSAINDAGPAWRAAQRAHGGEEGLRFVVTLRFGFSTTMSAARVAYGGREDGGGSKQVSCSCTRRHEWRRSSGCHQSKGKKNQS
jgi:hypothetical protein